MTGEISRGWRLFRGTFTILKMENSLVFFPVISGLIGILVFIVFFAPVFFLYGFKSPDVIINSLVHPWESNLTGWIIWFVWLFLLYLVSIFNATFFEAAIIANATEVINGRNPSIMDGISASFSRIRGIFAWSMVKATVGMIIRMIIRRDSIIGSIIAGSLLVVWDLATFFMIPVILYEEKSTLGSIRQSWNIFKNTWGETFVSTISFVVILILVIFLVFVVALSVMSITRFSSNPILPYIYVLIIYMPLMITGIIISTLEGILVALLYKYAKTGVIYEKIDKDLVLSAFVESQKRELKWRI